MTCYLDRGRFEPGASTPSANVADPQLRFLEELVAERATIAGDILELDPNTFAIHGTIAVDGDVIMAEYDTEAHARTVLDQLTAKPTPGIRGRSR